MRRALLLVTACGCRQIFGLDSPNPTSDAATIDTGYLDARDAQGGTCIDRWIQGPQFAQTIAIPGPVNSGSQERYPFVTANGLTIYFVRDSDYQTATRPDLASNFGSVAKLTDLSSGSGDAKIYISDDETRAFFASNRGGGSGGTDLWRGHRQSVSDPWQIDQMFLGNLNASGNQVDPFLSPDLLQIYFAIANGGTDIYASSRLAANDAFANAVKMTELSTNADDDQPTLTADGRVIVFTSSRTNNFDLYYATRSGPAEPFNAPQPLTALNLSQKTESGAFITADGCQLYFMSDRNGSFDIYTTTLLD